MWHSPPLFKPPLASPFSLPRLNSPTKIKLARERIISKVVSNDFLTKRKGLLYLEQVITMSKLNDSSAIKLFGKMIPLLTLNQEEALADHELSFREAVREDCFDRNFLSSSNSLGGVNSNDGVQAQASREDQEPVDKEFLKDKHEDGASHQIKDDLGITDNGRSPSAERKTSSLENSKNEEKSETNSSQEKTSKKPDKILPCPRCNSKETKFCYYNNYNVNQPRHYCKNCQRYWTAGGAMRNVPVGAGRRKTKNSSSSSALHYNHIMISEAIRAAQASAAANGIQRSPFCENNSSCVLTFGSDSSSVCNISGNPQITSDNHSGESLITASYSLEKEGETSLYQAEDKKNYQLFPSKVPCLTRPSWPYPWLPPPPTLYPPGFAALGKHSRDENIFNPANYLEKEKHSRESNKSEGRALNSKTLRIDDPGETAKSSMLTTLVSKTKKTTNSINSGGLFDGFQSKINDDRNYRRLGTFSVLRANPAALSRSLNFHENTS